MHLRVWNKASTGMPTLLDTQKPWRPQPRSSCLGRNAGLSDSCIPLSEICITLVGPCQADLCSKEIACNSCRKLVSTCKVQDDPICEANA